MKIVCKSQLPNKALPIYSIGAGGIVSDAHLPAYAKAGFQVKGIYDPNLERAAQVAKEFGIPSICRSLTELLENAQKQQAIIDIAVPAAEILNILDKIPDGSAVLIQKPMGEDLQEARKILSISNQKNLVAAINFQLRYAPFVIAAKHMIEQGLIGELYDLEVKVCTATPWHLWDFLATHPRVEILYHSIHYIDMIRSFFGNPARMMAKTVGHPMKTVSSTRSAIIMDYGNTVSANILTNHDHEFGPKHQHSYIKWEGTKGAIYAKMGVNLDYPKGVADVFEYCIKGEQGSGEWQEVKLEGSWFPDAFIGSMASLMRYVEGSELTLPTAVEDAFKTMQVVEDAYHASNPTKTPTNS